MTAVQTSSASAPGDTELAGSSQPSTVGTMTPLPNPLAGDPAMIGIPTVIAGAIGLGLTTMGYVPSSAANAALPIILTATGIGLLLATVWAAALGQNVAASIYAVFMGFYTSYAALALGLTHDWYQIPAGEASHAQAIWLMCWLATILILTFTTLKLPLAFTILFGLVDLALALLLLANLQGSTGLQRAGGVVVFAFIANAAYLYVNNMSLALGGGGVPLGRPVFHGG
jgi:succinate-acetate transporter protein